MMSPTPVRYSTVMAGHWLRAGTGRDRHVARGSGNLNEAGRALTSFLRRDVWRTQPGRARSAQLGDRDRGSRDERRDRPPDDAATAACVNRLGHREEHSRRSGSTSRCLPCRHALDGP
jgi:hypothetical protein